jgi:hypothetical protein
VIESTVECCKVGDEQWRKRLLNTPVENPRQAWTQASSSTLGLRPGRTYKCVRMLVAIHVRDDPGRSIHVLGFKRSKTCASAVF